MESLVSSLNQLMSGEGQPEHEPRADTYVTPDLGGTSSQFEQQEQARKPTIPPPPSLETLPVEIQFAILDEITSLNILRTLVHASPIFYWIYSRSRLPILKKVLKHTLDGISEDAHAAYRSGLAVPFSFDGYRSITASIEPAYEGLSPVEVTAMASFHLSIIEPLTERYAHWTLSALSSEASPLSKTERGRIQRAMYRLQILCNININETSLASILSQGLRVLANVCKANDSEELANVLEYAIVCGKHIHESQWIYSDAVGKFDEQDERRAGAYNEYDEAQDTRQEMHFEQDIVSSPPIAWVRFWDGLYSNQIGIQIPDALRRWGYVMWDAKTIGEYRGDGIP
ncbi:hypothetical protein VP1G_07476 [Cytospora mali]|uniref:F-box domain-containing protein n=1 Tax=Cytospora mali TaxID=578113 RepID=A0A194V8V4_CYTMA|nr:hypothetical protein VP1G_07476 [Valsa mali var. pyri (nom. inval.)]